MKIEVGKTYTSVKGYGNIEILFKGDKNIVYKYLEGEKRGKEGTTFVDCFSQNYADPSNPIYNISKVSYDGTRTHVARRGMTVEEANELNKAFKRIKDIGLVQYDISI